MDYTTQLDSIASSLAEINNSISSLAGVIGLLSASLSDIRDDIKNIKELANDSGIITKPFNADIQGALLRMTLADSNQIDRFKLAKEEYKIDPIV
jgi:hypothetical protein